MSILFWGITLGMIGKVLLAISVLKVHVVMERERGIDDKVIHSFHLEKILTLIAVGLVVVGYVMEMYFYSGTNMLICHGEECRASVIEAGVQ